MSENRVHHRKRFKIDRGNRRFVEGDSALVVFRIGDGFETFADWVKFKRGDHPQSEREFLGAVLQYEEQFPDA